MIKEHLQLQIISVHQLAHKFVYQMIQVPFLNYNIFLQQLLCSCDGIPSSKHADNTSSSTQVYPCNCCTQVHQLASLRVRTILIHCRYACSYNSLACQINFSVIFAQPSINRNDGLVMPYQYIFLANSICTDSRLMLKLLQLPQQCNNGAWLSLARSLVYTVFMNQKLSILIVPAANLSFSHTSQVHQLTLDDECSRFYIVHDRLDS